MRELALRIYERFGYPARQPTLPAQFCTHTGALPQVINRPANIAANERPLSIEAKSLILYSSSPRLPLFSQKGQAVVRKWGFPFRDRCWRHLPCPWRRLSRSCHRPIHATLPADAEMGAVQARSMDSDGRQGKRWVANDAYGGNATHGRRRRALRRGRRHRRPR